LRPNGSDPSASPRGHCPERELTSSTGVTTQAAAKGTGAEEATAKPKEPVSTQHAYTDEYRL